MGQVDVQGIEVGLDDDEYLVQLYRMQAASDLAGLAWAQDPAYADLREAMVGHMMGVRMGAEASAAELAEQIERFQAACTDVTG